MSQSKCPVCSSTLKPTLIAKINSEAASRYFVKVSGAIEPKVLQEHIESLWKSKECQIYKCGKCESNYSYPHVAGDSRFYTLVSPNPTYPNWRWEFDLTKRQILESFRHEDMLLEIGGGSGAFLKLLIDGGVYPQNIVATEFTPVAQLELRRLGVNVESVNFRLGVPGGPFRFIVLFQTLEHLDNLEIAAKGLGELGTEDAEVFLSVPNVGYSDWSFDKIGITDMPPNHVTTFSPEGLRMLFEAHGWQIMSLKMHERNSLVARCKHGVMRGIIHPDGHIQRMLSLAYLRSSSRLGKLPLFVFAGLMLLTNPSLVRPVPPEEIWLHAKRKSFS